MPVGGARRPGLVVCLDGLAFLDREARCWAAGVAPHWWPPMGGDTCGPAPSLAIEERKAVQANDQSRPPRTTHRHRVPREATTAEESFPTHPSSNGQPTNATT